MKIREYWLLTALVGLGLPTLNSGGALAAQERASQPRGLVFLLHAGALLRARFLRRTSRQQGPRECGKGRHVGYRGARTVAAGRNYPWSRKLLY